MEMWYVEDLVDLKETILQHLGVDLAKENFIYTVTPERYCFTSENLEIFVGNEKDELGGTVINLNTDNSIEFLTVKSFPNELVAYLDATEV